MLLTIGRIILFIGFIGGIVCIFFVLQIRRNIKQCVIGYQQNGDSHGYDDEMLTENEQLLLQKDMKKLHLLCNLSIAMLILEIIGFVLMTANRFISNL